MLKRWRLSDPPAQPFWSRGVRPRASAYLSRPGRPLLPPRALPAEEGSRGPRTHDARTRLSRRNLHPRRSRLCPHSPTPRAPGRGDERRRPPPARALPWTPQSCFPSPRREGSAGRRARRGAGLRRSGGEGELFRAPPDRPGVPPAPPLPRRGPRGNSAAPALPAPRPPILSRPFAGSAVSAACRRSRVPKPRPTRPHPGGPCPARELSVATPLTSAASFGPRGRDPHPLPASKRALPLPMTRSGPGPGRSRWEPRAGAGRNPRSRVRAEEAAVGRRGTECSRGRSRAPQRRPGPLPPAFSLSSSRPFCGAP